jgi:hypothetical protein
MVYHSGILVRRQSTVCNQRVNQQLANAPRRRLHTKFNHRGRRCTRARSWALCKEPGSSKTQSAEVAAHRMGAPFANARALRILKFFRYVVPIIFAPERLNDDLLKSASKPIESRQTVVHGGQRAFPDFYILREYIRDVARVCLVLIDSTAEVPTDTAAP